MAIIHNLYTETIDYILMVKAKFGVGNSNLVKMLTKEYIVSDFVQNEYFASKKLKLSETLRNGIQNIITDYEKIANGYSDEQTLEYYHKNDKGEKVKRSVTVGDIRKGNAVGHFEDAIRVKKADGGDYVENLKFIKKYYFISLFTKNSEGKYDRDFVNSVIQMAMSGINLQTEIERDDDGKILETRIVVHNDKADNATKNPLGSRSQVFNLIFDNIPLLTITGNRVITDGNKSFVNGKVLHDIIINAVVQLKKKGTTFSATELFDELIKYSEKPGMSKAMRDTIHSFLYYVGPWSTERNFTNSQGVEENAFVKFFNEGEYSKLQFDGMAVGIHYALNNEHILNAFKNDPTMVDKLKEYRDLINGLTSYYESLYNRVSLIADHNKRKGDISVKERIINKVEKAIDKKNIENTVSSVVGSNGILSQDLISYLEKGLLAAPEKLSDQLERHRGDYNYYSKFIFNTMGVHLSATVVKDVEIKGSAKLHEYLEAWVASLEFRAANNFIFESKTEENDDSEEAPEIAKTPEETKADQLAKAVSKKEKKKGFFSILNEAEKNNDFVGLEEYKNQLTELGLPYESRSIFQIYENRLFKDFFSSVVDAVYNSYMYKTDTMITGANGNAEYTKPLSSFFFDNVFGGVAGDEATNHIRNYVLEELKNTNHSALHKGDQYFNPILNKKIIMESVYVFNGAKNQYGKTKMGYANRDMTSFDKFRIMKELMIEGAEKNRTILYAYSDTMADKTTLPMFKYSIREAQGSARNAVVMNFVDGKFSINTDYFGSIIKDFMKYDANLYDIAKNEWKKVTGKENVKYDVVKDAGIVKDIKYNLNKKYWVEKDGILSIPGKAGSSISKIDAMDNEKVYRQFLKDNLESFASMVRAMHKVGFLQTFSEEELDLKGKSYEEVLNYGFTRMVDGQIYGNTILEGMFMSHYIANRSISNIVRGDISESNGVIDWVKRAAGLIAPGNAYVTKDTVKWFGNGLRTLVMQDIKVGHPLYSQKKVWGMDGAILLNPIYQKMLIIATGGMLSVVSNASLKNVYYNYDKANNNLDYLKFNHFPITKELMYNNEFYQSAFKMMLGQGKLKELYDNFREEGLAFDSTLDRLAEFLISEEGAAYRNEMVAQIAFSESYKQGIRRINEFPEGTTMENMAFPNSLNDDSKVVVLDPRGLRMQQITLQDPLDAETSIPIQIMRIAASKSLNEGLGFFSKDLNAKLDTESGRHVFFNDALIKAALRGQNYDKVSEIMLELGISKSTITKKAIQAVGSVISKQMRGSLPGSYHIQAPHWGGTVGDQKRELKIAGYKYTGDRKKLAKALGLEGDNIDLSPYIDENNNVVSKQALILLLTSEKIAGKLKFQKPEVIMAFNHAKIFGIDRGESLIGAMTIRNPFTKAEASMHDENGEMSYNEINVMVNKLLGEQIYSKKEINSIFGDKTGIAKIITRKVDRYEKESNDITKEYNDNLEEKLTQVRIEFGENPELKNFIYSEAGIDLGNSKTPQEDKEFVETKYAKYQLSREKNSTRTFKEYLEAKDKESQVSSIDIVNNRIRKAITEYYFNLNNALDVFYVRLPTTDASMGSPARIAEFLWDTQNTIYTNTKKNILDGADYDADQMNVFYKSFDSEGNLAGGTAFKTSPYEVEMYQRHKIENEKEINQNKIFKGITEFYKDPANHLSTLSTIDLDSFIELSKQSPLSTQNDNHYYNPATSIMLQEINYSGTNMVGHGANIASALFVLNSLVKNNEKFAEEKLNNSIFTKPRSVFYEAVQYAVKFTNAATDNAKLGGVLGLLNINPYTSPIVSGILYMGGISKELKQRIGIDENASLEQQINMLLISPMMIKYSEHLRKDDKMTNLYKPSFYSDGVKNVLGDTYREIKGYADAANALLSLYPFNQLYNVDESFFGRLDLLIFDIESSLGMKIIEFLNSNSTPTLSSQVDFFRKRYSKLFSTRKQGNELEIRSVFNIHAIVSNLPDVMSALKCIINLKNMEFENLITRGFSINEIHVIDFYYNNLAPNSYIVSSNISYIYDELERGLYGVFLDSISMSLYSRMYHFSNLMDRIDFAKSFVNYVIELKEHPLYLDNIFVLNLRVVMLERNFHIIEFNGSNSIDAMLEFDYRESFMQLDSHSKKLFRYYQLLMFGFSLKSGSFFNVMDFDLEWEFTTFKEKYQFTEIVKELLIVDVALRSNIGFYANDSMALLELFYYCLQKQMEFKETDNCCSEYNLDESYSFYNNYKKGLNQLRSIKPTSDIFINKYQKLANNKMGQILPFSIQTTGNKITISKSKFSKWINLYSAKSPEFYLNIFLKENIQG